MGNGVEEAGMAVFVGNGVGVFGTDVKVNVGNAVGEEGTTVFVGRGVGVSGMAVKVKAGTAVGVSVGEPVNC